MTERSVTTIGECVERCQARLETAGVTFGHGTDNALDEAAWLVLHVMNLPLDGHFEDWDAAVPAGAQRRIAALLERRATERIPLAYLLGEAWFCGLRFEAGPGALVPRSPLAELIAGQFEPWVRPERVARLLDLCTGSGCIAIASALHLPRAKVDAVDISAEALAIARRNVERHGVAGRVELIASDLFARLGGRRYDLIVSNPPYVPGSAVDALPREYAHEPRLGLAGGNDGLDLVLRILAEAPAHLQDQGVLICEVGESADRLQERLPDAELTWLEFEHGGEGVFTIAREELERMAPVPG